MLPVENFSGAILFVSVYNEIIHMPDIVYYCYVLLTVILKFAEKFQL
jgi:hypothetical protein